MRSRSTVQAPRPRRPPRSIASSLLLCPHFRGCRRERARSRGKTPGQPTTTGPARPKPDPQSSDRNEQHDRKQERQQGPANPLLRARSRHGPTRQRGPADLDLHQRSQRPDQHRRCRSGNDRLSRSPCRSTRRGWVVGSSFRPRMDEWVCATPVAHKPELERGSHEETRLRRHGAGRASVRRDGLCGWLVRQRPVHEPGRELADDGRRLPGSARLEGSRGGHMPAGAVQREPLRVVARGQARDARISSATSKFFFETYSTFYMFHLGAYQILGRDARRATTRSRATTASRPGRRTCRRAGRTTPIRTSTSTRRAASTRRRCRSTRSGTRRGCTRTAEIDVSYSDDMGRHWVKGNGGKPLEPPNNASARQFGHVEDKQWIAVNHISGNRYQDHVYAAWAVFNGSAIKVRMAVSRDRGQTFAKAVTISPPCAGRPAAPRTSTRRSTRRGPSTSRSCRSRRTAARRRSTSRDRPMTAGASARSCPSRRWTASRRRGLPNTSFRDGITESFAASPTYPGHLYLTYEDWDGRRPDGREVHAVDRRRLHLDDPGRGERQRRYAGRADRSVPAVGRGRARTARSRSRSTTAARPARTTRASCPIDVGRTNFCIDTSLQAYKDCGRGRRRRSGRNVRMSQFTWDPEQPGQQLGGLSQYPCAGAQDPCPTGRGFIGDYFGLAISDRQHLRPLRLDALPVERNRRRGRARSTTSSRSSRRSGAPISASRARWRMGPGPCGPALLP